ncbi:TMEM175 family protein [Deinococcus detaillensis]|uniref:TMEM175 family protein n=1 Tax=Deinococcus detaillensis TaxID=2592048 RepID=UPI001CDC0DBD|nr:TMEM175 family protein [Deinococcus detaillensis]
MGKTRLEAFSDGVLASIITIMALELGAPECCESVLFPTSGSSECWLRRKYYRADKNEKAKARR